MDKYHEQQKQNYSEQADKQRYVSNTIKHLHCFLILLQDF